MRGARRRDLRRRMRLPRAAAGQGGQALVPGGRRGREVV
jgi:hypothetical protein